VTKTGTWVLPLWTAIVCPTISGKMVDVRDHVRSGLFWPDSFISSTRFMRADSTNGPFLDDLDN